MNDDRPELDLMYMKKMKKRMKKTLSKNKKYLKKAIKSYVEHMNEKKEIKENEL